MGYATHQKGYRCYYPPTQRTYVTMDVTFLESEMYFTPSSNSSLQGEIRNEEHNWTDFDFLTNKPETMVTETIEPVSTLVSPMASEVENTSPTISSEPEEEDPSHQILVPKANETPENIREVTTHTPHSTCNTCELPFRHNRGKPAERILQNM